MEEVAAVRRAALDAVGDVEPDGLRERIQERLDDGSLAPGVLAVLSARAVFESGDDAAFPTDAVADRGAGVQLIYEGLRLTRTLAQDPPWERGRSLTDGAGDATDVEAGGGLPDDAVGTDVDPPDLTDADLAILVADILVARGFYLLARTEAAVDAVETVQSFGRDQTEVRVNGDPTPDGNLEADVFELAAVAGTTAVGGTATEAFREDVAAMAHGDGPLPLADVLFTDATVGELTAALDGGAVAGEDVARSADH